MDQSTNQSTNGVSPATCCETLVEGTWNIPEDARITWKEFICFFRVGTSSVLVRFLSVRLARCQVQIGDVVHKNNSPRSVAAQSHDTTSSNSSDCNIKLETNHLKSRTTPKHVLYGPNLQDGYMELSVALRSAYPYRDS